MSAWRSRVVVWFGQVRRRLTVHTWTVKDYLRRQWLALRRFRGLWTIAVPAVAAIVALVLDGLMPANVAPSVVGSFLIGTATLVGGFLTVAFALSVSLQQSLASLYSPQHLAEYSYGPRQKLTFVVIVAGVLACLAVGLYCVSIPAFGTSGFRTVCVVLGFATLGLVLALIEVQLRQGTERLRPTAAITFLREEAIRHLKRLDVHARRLAERLRLDRDIEPEQAIAWAYRQLSDTSGKLVVHHLSRLQEMALRLSDRADSVAAGHALEAWGIVLQAYLENRRDCSLAFPSPTHVMAVESDSQWILSRGLEQLNDLGIRFLRNGQVQNARAVVRVYDNLSAVAATVRFVNRSGENPISDQLGWYLQEFVKAAVKESDPEVAFAAIDVFTNLGLRCIEAGLPHAPYATCRQLDTIVASAARPATSFVVERCIDAFARLLWALLTTARAPRNFQPVLESLERAHRLVFVAQVALNPSGGPGEFWTSLRAPFDRFRDVIQSFIAWFRDLREEQQATHAASFVDFVDDLSGFIRRAAEGATSRNGYVDLIPHLIFEVVSGLLAVHRSPHGKPIEEARTWTYLLTWIAHQEKPFKDADAVLNAAKTAARIALLLVSRSAPDELVLAAIDTQRSLAQRVIEHHAPSWGYDEPRAIAPMCFVVALALKQGNAAALAVGVRTVRQLSAEYEKKFSGTTSDGHQVTPPTSVLRELRSDREEFVERDAVAGIVNSLLGDAMRLLSLSDLDRAIWYLWATVPKGSPIAKEFEDRRSLSSRLIRVLRERLAAESIGQKTEKT